MLDSAPRNGVDRRRRRPGSRVEAPTKSSSIHGDADRIVQVLVNLLSNAVKPASARVAVVTIAVTADGQWTEFRVSIGPGVPAVHRRAIFSVRQVDPSDAREKGERFIGLAICKSVSSSTAEHRRGERGRRRQRVLVSPGDTPDDDAIVKVLIIDDDADRFVGRWSPRERAIDVVENSSGLDGVLAYCREQPDVHSPRHDDAEWMGRRRHRFADGRKTATTPVIFLTAKTIAASIRGMKDRSRRRVLISQPFDPSDVDGRCSSPAPASASASRVERECAGSARACRTWVCSGKSRRPEACRRAGGAYSHGPVIRMTGMALEAQDVLEGSRHTD